MTHRFQLLAHACTRTAPPEDGMMLPGPGPPSPCSHRTGPGAAVMGSWDTPRASLADRI